jgi:tetratricopeptide (TPR) repeat protein
MFSDSDWIHKTPRDLVLIFPYNKWIYKASQELDVLAGSLGDDPEDAWRAVVLSARLRGAPDGPTLPASIDVLLPKLLLAAGSLDCDALLDTFADELESLEDPWGPLMDALLDIDDALGVLALSGDEEEARELSVRVAALTSLYPERVVALNSFARMRLETVRDDSYTAEVWRTVAHASAQLLADALPVQAHHGAEELRSLASKHSWLGALYPKMRRLLDEAAEAISAGILAYINPAGSQPDFAASLSTSAGMSRRIELVWGEFPCLELTVGESIEMDVPPTCQLWYALDGASSSFRDANWVFEQDESPVLIVATESSDAQTLEDALTIGGRVSGLILVERVDTGREQDYDKKEIITMNNKKTIENMFAFMLAPQNLRKARVAWEATQDYQRQLHATPKGRQSNILREEGHRLKSHGDLEQAHERFVLALSLHAVDDEGAAVAACWYDLGQSFTEIRTGIREQNLMNAVQLLRRAELAPVRRADVRRHILSLDGLGRAYRAVAVELRNEKALAEATRCLREAISLAREHGVATLDLLMNSLSNLGNALVDAGTFDEAVRAQEESLQFAETVERDLPEIAQLMLEGLRLPLRRLNLVRALHARGQHADRQRAQKLVDTIVTSDAPPNIIAQAYLMGYDIAKSLGMSNALLIQNYLNKTDPNQLIDIEILELAKNYRDEGVHEHAIYLARQGASHAIQERHDAKSSPHADHCAAKAQRFSRLAAELLVGMSDPLAAFVALENTAAMRYFDAVTQYVWSADTPLLHALDMLHKEASGASAALDDLALRIAGIDPSKDRDVFHSFLDMYIDNVRTQQKTSELEWEGSAARLQEVVVGAQQSNTPGDVLRKHSQILGEVTIALKATIERLDPSSFKVSDQDWSNEVSEEMVRRVFDEEPEVVLLRLSMSADNLLAVSVWRERDALRGDAKTFEVDAAGVRALSMLAHSEELEGGEAERAQTALDAFLASVDLSLVLPKATTHVILLPSQLAAYVPWAACGPPGRMLIDVVEAVSYLPNLMPLWMRQAPWVPRSGTLLVAPGEAGEHPTQHHSIAFSKAADDETRLFGAAATWAAVGERVASADVVSFFAHGSYNAQHPLGAILLADGHFLPRKCFDVWRGVERVEIWACRTGVNVSYDPLTPRVDEGFGLDVDLHHLGVRSTIGTLWNVPDLVTALLVKEYRSALARGRSAPAALADAQRWWRKEGLGHVQAALESDDPKRNLRERFASLGGEAASVDDFVDGVLGLAPKTNTLSVEERTRQFRKLSLTSAWAGFRFVGVYERRPLRDLSPPRELTLEERAQIKQLLKDLHS